MKNQAKKSRILALAATVAALFATGQVAAQDFSLGWNPRTGDVWVDSRLDDVNRYGSRYQQPFVDEMVRYYGAPRDLVSSLLTERNWAPGDIYYACAIAQIIGRPCRYVVDEWERDHGQGWGNVARQMGIKPGSSEFHRLKRGFVSSYDRWGRPIRIDEDLYRDYPQRARAAHSQAGDDRDPGNSGKKSNSNSNKGNSNNNKGNSNNNSNDSNKGNNARKANQGKKGNNGKGNDNG